MLWVAATLSVLLSTVALIVAVRTRRRVFRSLPAKGTDFPHLPAPDHTVSDVELSLEAMLYELETKRNEIIRAMERKAAQLGVDAAETSLARRTDAASSLRSDEKRATVKRLAAEGYDVAEIAKRLGLGLGEVQLILDLPDGTAL